MPELDIARYLKPEDVAPEAELAFITAGEKSFIPGKDDKPDTPTFEITVGFKNKEQSEYAKDGVLREAEESVSNVIENALSLGP